jgi:hypothetical protein
MIHRRHVIPFLNRSSYEQLSLRIQLGNGFGRGSHCLHAIYLFESAAVLDTATSIQYVIHSPSLFVIRSSDLPTIPAAPCPCSSAARYDAGMTFPRFEPKRLVLSLVFLTSATVLTYYSHPTYVLSHPQEFLRSLVVSGLMGAAVGAPFRQAGYAGLLVAMGVNCGLLVGNLFHW